jgi:tetratricopeptide (TPR) repeat protein
MASDKTLNTKNLAALGADRLAELLLELASGDAAAKRRLRIELASRDGGASVVPEIRKRLTTIGKSRSFVDWQKIRALSADLDMQRDAIAKYVAPTQPGEAMDLLWRLLDLAPSLYERCDDSNGTISGVMAEALNDLGAVAARAKPDTKALAEKVFAGVSANDYGQFDGLIGLMADSLGPEGLAILKAKFEEREATPRARTKAPERRVIGISTRGPIFEDDFEARYEARRVRSALTEIADALGDVDGYIMRFSALEQTNPSIAADIAERLLNAQRPEEALAALNQAAANLHNAGHWPDWPRVRIDVLDALGRTAEAQSERWTIFERSLNAEYLRAHLKRLPDFDDEEAETRALAYVCQSDDFYRALGFLMDWPAHGLAAELVLTRHDQLDGDHYWLLTSVAESLESSAPLAATLLLRSMIDYALDRAKSKRYGHAARHLQTCGYLAKRIEDFGEHPDHDAYVASLKARHGRKSGFWGA